MLHPSQQPLPEVIRILRHHRVKRAHAFGSAVSGGFGPDSDLDLLVAFQENLDPVEYGTHYLDALYELQDLLNRNVNLVAEETLFSPVLIDSVNRTKTLLYE